MLILSTTVFEWFYGRVLGLDRQSYLRGYRNEWSWQYARVLRAAGMQPIIAVRSLGSPALFRTDDGILVRAPLVGRYLTEVLSTLATLRYLQPAFADLVYVQEYWTGQFDLISLSAKIPVVAGDHGGGASGQRKILKRAALRRAVWVTSQTRAEASVVRRYGGRAEVLPNAVDTRFFCPGDGDPSRADAPPSILVVARLADRQKRISDVMRAIARLDRSWTLEVVGTGPDAGRLQDLARRLRVADRVTFSGFVSDREAVRDRYRSCGVMVMASAHEARTLAVLEALACGCPTVVTDLPVFRELADEAGDVAIRVPVGNPVALARAIELAYGRRAELARRSREAAAQHFSLDAFSSRLVSLVAEAADANRTGIPRA
jgi:glycosyltransferase involved in cell wall biosynthesis